MKNSIYSILTAYILLFSACNDEDIPKANFNTYEVAKLQATAGDEEITLSWEALEGSNPSGYYVSWTASSLTLKGGDLSVEGNTTTATITELVNGGDYTFSVQPVYSDGRKGGKISVKTKPVSSKIPVSNLIAAAGNEKVRLRWTKPLTDKLSGYRLLVSTFDEPIVIDKNQESHVVTGLTNDTEYEFSLICVYPNGTSDQVSIKSTPGEVHPVTITSKTLFPNNLLLNQSCTFEYNDLYFVMGTVKSVSWNFGDGNTSTEEKPTHSFAALGDYTVEATVRYEDNTIENGSIVIKVNGYAKEIGLAGLFGNVKVSNPVFSPDGKTAYIPTSTPGGHLFALDVATGTTKWVYQIPAVTYGGGALVGTDGTIYVCGTDNTVYAIHPDGTGKWTCSVDGVIGAFPALSSDGTVYCATNKGTLHAINASTGAVKWDKTLDITSTAGAVAVDAENNVYVGTDLVVCKFNAIGIEQWKTSGTVKVTERGSFAMDASGTVLYAALKGGDGLAAIDMTTGSMKWSYPNGSTGGDAYFPIVGPDGTVYFNEKGSSGSRKIYALTSGGSLKWEKNVGVPFTYCGAVLADNGKIYCGTQGAINKMYTLYGFDAATGDVVYTYESADQFMSSATIGPDRRLYIGTIGTVNSNKGLMMVLPIDGGPETSSWSVRGGNIYGTNRK